MKTLKNLIVVNTLLIIVSLIGCAPCQSHLTNGKIVFQSDRDGNYDLYIMNPDGSDQRNLTNGPPSINRTSNNVGPVPSPDGKRIAFESDRDGNIEIYVINLESGVQLNLTKNNANDYSPTWSPDGKYIAFLSDRDATLVDIDYRYDNWTNNIYIMNADGSNVRRLTYNNVTDGYGGLSWSPDGKQLALDLSSTTPYGGYFSKGIHLLDLDDLTLTRLTYDTATIQFQPRWSPDGKRIVYVVAGSALSQIYIMDANGQNQVPLSKDLAVYDTAPSWSPDGKCIIFSSRRDGKYHIYIMNADGTNQKRLTNGPGEETSPVWLSVP